MSEADVTLHLEARVEGGPRNDDVGEGGTGDPELPVEVPEPEPVDDDEQDDDEEEQPDA